MGWRSEEEKGKWIPCPRIHQVSESKLDRVSDLFVSSDRIDCWMNWKEITFLPSVLQLLLLLLANETTAKSGQDDEKCLGFSENFSMWWLIRDHSSLFGPSSRRRIGSWMCSSIEKLLEDLSQVPVRVKNDIRRTTRKGPLLVLTSVFISHPFPRSRRRKVDVDTHDEDGK